ncbi:MAG: lysozyme inhibitor LprI family protein [Ferruginibacter sp.]
MKIAITIILLLFMQVAGNAQTQMEMNEQAAREFKAADKTMSALYKKVMALQDDAGKKLLLEAQRAWIKYKEAHCESAANMYRDGSIYPLIYNSCLRELTEERTKKLQQYIDEMN